MSCLKCWKVEVRKNLFYLTCTLNNNEILSKTNLFNRKSVMLLLCGEPGVSPMAHPFWECSYDTQ